ncbi:hypothetical protein B296_00049156, partial [Ensete ventricosum]
SLTYPAEELCISSVKSAKPVTAYRPNHVVLTPRPRRNLSRADDELKSFQSCLGWVCIDQSDATHAMVYWSIFLLCIHIAFHFILSYAPTRYAYGVMV